MSDMRIGTKNFGKVYLKGKRYRSHREWRGIVDTLYDYSRWLYNWFNMFIIVLSKPRNIKAMFRYRWMVNYLARGSEYLPGDSGLCVPIELSMGTTFRDGNSIKPLQGK